MTVAELAKHLNTVHRPVLGGDNEWDHSLRSLAQHHANHPETMHVGTAFDWEDLEAYRTELERMDWEGPGCHSDTE